MKIDMNWKGGMCMEAEAGGLTLLTDARPPIGKGLGMTPKELLLAGLGGCSAVDILAFLKKHKQPLESFHVEVDAESTVGVYPAVFTQGKITYTVAGEVNLEILKEAVVKSQTLYCGVSAMLAKAFPISYTTVLNGEVVQSGQAHFND